MSAPPQMPISTIISSYHPSCPQSQRKYLLNEIINSFLHIADLTKHLGNNYSLNSECIDIFERWADI